MARPTVGLTWGDDLVARSAGPGENALKYLSLLIEAGMTPVLLTPGIDASAVARLDGLLLPGGPDIAPSLYGQAPDERLEAVVPELDELELNAFHAARARRLPVLGICRGQQLINVALGGTLHQHIDHPQWDGDASAPTHDVDIVAGTHLRSILGMDTAAVNSGHHQAVDLVAQTLTASARSADGVIEALEAPEMLLMSVQWHPDEMRHAPTTRAVMAGFLAWMGGGPL